MRARQLDAMGVRKLSLFGVGRARAQEWGSAYVLIAPAIAALAIFLVIPILASFALVFAHYDLLTPPRWAGLENLQQLLGDRRLRTVYWNSLQIVVGATFLNQVLGLLLAMGVNRAMPAFLRYLLRTALFFPVLTTTASLALVWRFILSQDRGVLNYILQQLGLAPLPWLTDPHLALVSVILYDVWKSCGYLMVLYLAGLQGIPDELYEAAKVDGANRLQLVRHITLPLITPTAFFATVISIVFLLRQHFMTLPQELMDAAKIDGASFFRIFFQIMLPLVGPALSALGIFTFLGSWNNFFGPLIFLRSWDKFTLPIAIVTLQGYMGMGNRAHVLAGIMLSILPILVVFLLAQRFIIRGIAFSGMKG
ncbi:binding-protein-dependent transport systems inner membrane component [Thermobaculum terrenum ATCC BAA-798]|uniref:Binding-protein-dependent transport systems inner membrane component n=1 Tax=Thermobaculum terrenum (strain ATCC BAA-798 / CCMEE 7001 / YNP1) TaxID=525904 RepID=D1CHZ5_THET1|nr:ABC transporter permease subunit [Thermobaculum terrenum]ACZ43366.1 binding-protein-dependent transport systems inner membrane component [Thermobaculum terrenum ATCC BAA-798]